MNTSKWPGYQMCPGVQINSPLGRERNEGYEGICPKQIFLKNWDCERRGGVHKTPMVLWRRYKLPQLRWERLDNCFKRQSKLLVKVTKEKINNNFKQILSEGMKDNMKSTKMISPTRQYVWHHHTHCEASCCWDAPVQQAGRLVMLY